jgi:HPt (histidine-containing phosphotransfer) domain-containing protein
MPATVTLNAPDEPPSEGMPGLEAKRPVDLVHLARSTLGDRGLEREVLALFARQATILLGRMAEGDAATVAGLAHTLKGSARGIGAWRVAAAAESAEAAAGRDRAAIDAALAVLSQHVVEAEKFIADLLRTY